MKDTTRQMILLVGILSLMTSALVVVNYSQTTSPSQPQTSSNDTVEPSNQSQIEENPDSPVGKSIKGWKMLIRDIKVTTNDLLGLNVSNSS